MIGFVQSLGASVLALSRMIGGIVLFTAIALRWVLVPPFYGRQIVRQMVDIGYYSLPVVGLTTLFSGMVLALQSYTGFARFSAEDTVATVVVLSITRELGPVLAGLMVAGRVGASIAAEIGTMRVTDQIDALDTLSTRPMQYLVGPRIIAGIVCLPILVLIGDIIGVFGGYLVGVYNLDFNASVYLSKTLGIS
jgi:phospholipid/cholesterol/gamma-HCH transport system permease protein